MQILRLRTLIAAVAVTAALATAPARAQEAGYWRATSQTARSITGDIGFGGSSIAINFSNFSFFKVRPLTSDEIVAAFAAEQAEGGGNLFKLNIPGDKRFLHKNTLCGAEDVHWMATYISGRTLEVAFFSGAELPVLKAEALLNSTNLCGTYTYSR